MASIISAGTSTGTALNLTGDTSGILQLASNNGTVGLTMDTSQNVGIGTSTIGTKLNVLLGTSYTIGSNWNTSVVTFGQAISSGGVAGGALGVSFDTTNGATLSSLNPGVSWYQMQLAGNYIAFRTGGSAIEAARIDGSGNLLVACTALPTSSIAGRAITTAYYQSSCGSTTSSYTHFYFTNGNGNVGTIVTNGSSTAFNTSSDYRLKENVQQMSGGLSTVLQLKPVTYDWISDKSKGQGFIAHELQAVVPDCVTGEKDAVDAEGKPVYQGIDTSFLVATLTAAIQEQQALITQLQADVAALKGAK